MWSPDKFWRSFGFNLWKVVTVRNIQKIVVNLVTLLDSTLYFNLNIICEDYVIKGKLLGCLETGNAFSFVEKYFTCSLQLLFLLFSQRPVFNRSHFSGRPPLSGRQF